MPDTTSTSAPSAPQPRPRIRKPVGSRLSKLLAVVFALFAIIVVTSVYLAVVTFANWVTGREYQGYFYQYMFLGHLTLGLLLIVPVVMFGVFHMLNGRGHPNKRAKAVGFGLFTVAVVVLGTGIALTRIEGLIDLGAGTTRTLAYWLHVILPIAAIWLFVLHRLAGRKIRWRVGLSWGAVATGFAVLMLVFHLQDPRQWNEVGPASGERYFFPSLARTSTGNFIPAEAMLNDAYCLKCHEDNHRNWAHSVHHFSSFNNPAYEASVLQTRKAMYERHGEVNGSRWCAGCHDPVPFFSGAFDDPKFDDPEYDLASDELAQAGITCTVCHAITNINSNRGNSDFTIEEPLHYPFAFSDNAVLQWVNNTLVKAKPAMHRATFLKPFHKTAEFCSTCHKVHLPVELNDYKFLRGQNHYDPYHLSGVSGHGITSFYYPPKATHNCSECHMPLMASDDFGARDFEGTGELTIHNHQFPTANTAIPYLLGMPDWVNDAHVAFLEGVMRVDIFGIKEGGTIDGELHAPLRPDVPTLTPGETYLVETIIRTLKMGHLFTQGTIDSNEVWLDVTVTQGGRVIGRSGGMDEIGDVDPWSHFVNAFVIDREGNRIDRRNPEDIFFKLIDNQIPPGAADVVHYQLRLPEDSTDPVTISVKLQYRKFDATYMKFFQGEDFVRNDLPIVTLATDTVTLPVAGGPTDVANAPLGEFPLWQRWNDYGIATFREGNEGSSKGELRQSEEAFAEVGRLGRPDGALNRARVYIKEGRLDDAIAALQEAAAHDPPAPPWSVAYFSGLVNKQYGRLDEAIEDFLTVVEMDTEETRRREFDFSQDYRLLGTLAQTYHERAKLERGEARRGERERLLREAVSWYEKALALDMENVEAHYGLAQAYRELGDETRSAEHRALHEEYKPDDNARGVAVVKARQKYPHADHAAEAVVIWDLQRAGARELPATRTAEVSQR